MELRAAGLKEQPFRTHGKPVVFVTYEGQQKAFAFLRQTCAHNAGLALFQGPSLAGKTTILRQFTGEHRKHFSIALVNGAGLNTTRLLEAVLKQFGYEYKFDSVNELLGLLKVYIRQQTATANSPLLIIENAHRLVPSALSVLCDLAEVRIREKYCLKIVLVSDRSINYIIRSPAMVRMAKRLTGDFHLEALSMPETNDYLYAKLRHGGCLDPDQVFPEAVCDEMYRASGGWPGVIDRLGVLALAKAGSCPVSIDDIEHPAIPQSTNITGHDEFEPQLAMRSSINPFIFVTHNGRTLQKFEFKGSRLLIGRSAHNDVRVDSRFISRHHTLLVRNGESTLLMDLNSANGTYVNSWRVSNQVLLHNDIITIGEHGLKFVHARARDRAALEGSNFNDTVVMQSMADMRHALTKEQTENLPVPENPADTRRDLA